MEKSEQIIEKQTVLAEKPGLTKRFTRFVGRLLSVLFLTSILGIVGVYLAIQTDTFRNWLRPILIEQINKQIKGTVYFEDIRIDVFRGIVFHQVSITALGDTVLTANDLAVSYNLEALFSTSLTINTLTLDSPSLTLLRSKDSTWNIEHILYPVPKDPNKAPFDWHVVVNTFELCNGRIVIRDSLNYAETPGLFTLAHADFNDVNTLLSAEAFPGIDRYELTLSQLSFKEHHSGLEVRDLVLHALHEKTGITVHEARISTPRSSIAFEGTVSGINLFDSVTAELLQSAPVTLSLKANRFNPDDARIFLPDIGFYGSYAIDLIADGTFHSINIDKLHIANGNSSLRLKGTIENLDRPSKFSFTAQSTGLSNIVYDELKRNTPVLQLPSLDYLGNVQFTSLLVKGRPSDSLHIEVDATTKTGAVIGYTNLVFRGKELAYDGDVRLTNVNPEMITGNSALQGSFNGQLTMKGSGTTLPTLNADIHINAGASKLGNYTFSSLLLSGHASNAGLIAIDTANIVFTEETHGEDEFDREKRSAFQCTGTIDCRESNPLIDIEADFDNVALSTIFETTTLPTRLDASVTLIASGLHPDSLEGSMHMHARQIIFNDRTVRPQNIDINIHRLSPTKRITTINSQLYTIEAKGEYRFEPFITAIDHMVSSVIIASERKYKGLSGIDLSNHALMPFQDSSIIDATISARTRDLAPINLFMQGINVSGEALLEASIQSNHTQTTMIIDTLFVKNGGINGTDNDAQSSPFMLHAKAITKPDTNNRRILSELTVDASCEDWLHINTLTLHKPILKASLIGTTFHGYMSSTVSHDFSAHGFVNADFTDTTFSFDTKDAVFRYGDFTWQSKKPIIGTLRASGLDITTLELLREKGETISASGHVSSTEFKGLSLDIEHFPLKDVQKMSFIPLDIREVLSTLKGNAGKTSLTADGPFTNPHFRCNGTIDSIYYNDIAVGNQTFQLQHIDSMITGFITVVDIKNPKVKTLHIDVEQIPYNLAITKTGKAMREDEPFVVIAQANALSIATIAPFIPGVSHLQGKADATITLGGYAPNKINYGGKAQLRDMSFVLDATNIKYYAGGRILLQNATATLDSVIVRNDKLDLQNGEALVTGILNLYDIIYIKNFDLNITSKQLMVLSDASEATMPAMYGKFIVASGVNPLHFYGTFKKPYLRGDVKVLQASITMPPEVEQVSASGVRYTVLNQEQRTKLKNQESPITDFIKALSTIKNSIPDKIAKDNPETQTEILDDNEALRRKRAGFNDLLDYDLHVLMPGKFMLKMILGTFEEIRANVEPTNKQSALRFQKDAFKLPRLFGEIKLLEGSQYKFLKVFDASGTLLFNTGELTNPTLDLLAVYKGQTRYEDELENFRVIMKITGTKNLPNVVITWESNGIEATGDSAQIRSDALMKLIVGRTQQELFGKGGSIGTKGLGNQISNSLSAAASQLFSGLLEGTGLLTNATISLQEGLSDLSQARLNLSGQLFSDVAWRAAGTLGDLSGNYEFSVDVPVTILGDYEALRNLLLQLTRASAPANAISTRQQKEWEMKISWRYAF